MNGNKQAKVVKEPKKNSYIEEEKKNFICHMLNTFKDFEEKNDKGIKFSENNFNKNKKIFNEVAEVKGNKGKTNYYLKNFLVIMPYYDDEQSSKRLFDFLKDEILFGQSRNNVVFYDSQNEWKKNDNANLKNYPNVRTVRKEAYPIGTIFVRCSTVCTLAEKIKKLAVKFDLLKQADNEKEKTRPEDGQKIGGEEIQKLYQDYKNILLEVKELEGNQENLKRKLSEEKDSYLAALEKRLRQLKEKDYQLELEMKSIMNQR